MYDIAIKLLSTARGMWRYRWVSLLVMWPIALAGWIFVIQMPPVYESKAEIYADTQSVLKPLLKDMTVETDVNDRILLMTQALLSRPNLESIILKTDLHLRVDNANQNERLISNLGKQIKISVPSRRKPNFYSITFQDTDPQMAQNVVQSLIDSLVEGTLLANRTDADNAEEFLIEQIADYEKRLKISEDKLAAFKQKNVGLMPNESGSYYQRLQRSIDTITDLDSKISISSRRRATLNQQLQNELSSSSASEINTKIQELQRQLDELSLSYTDQHPDIIALKENIMQLRQRRDAQVNQTSNSQIENEFLQQLKLSLSEVELELTTLRAQKRDQEKQVDFLRKYVDTIPEVEAELADLNRDYLVNKAQYEKLLERLESARLSEGIEESGDKVKFRIINPPQRALSPSGPPTLIFLAAVLVAAVGVGVGLAFVLNEVNPVFCTATEISTSLGIPVLGSVTLKWTDAERSKNNKRLLQLFVSFTALLAVFVIFVGIKVLGLLG